MKLTPSGGGVDTAFFNVQGDDDAFTVYSLADFDTSSIGEVAAITSLSIDLTQSNASFSTDWQPRVLPRLRHARRRSQETAHVTSQLRATAARTRGKRLLADAFGTLYSTRYR